MSNRRMFRNFMTLEKAPVALYCRFTVGSVGAPTMDVKNSKGFSSMSRTGVGAYTVNLGYGTSVDTYQRLLAFDYVSVFATPNSVNCYIVQDNSLNATAPNLKLQFVSAAGAPVELASGEDIRFEAILSNTTG